MRRLLKYLNEVFTNIYFNNIRCARGGEVHKIGGRVLSKIQFLAFPDLSSLGKVVGFYE